MLFIMYSPKIAKHTPKIYRISRAVGKPMTKVADDLISFGYQHLKSIYSDINDEEIDEILRTEYDPNFRKNK
jgi:hypothetical protein